MRSRTKKYPQLALAFVLLCMCDYAINSFALRNRDVFRRPRRFMNVGGFGSIMVGKLRSERPSRAKRVEKI